MCGNSQDNYNGVATDGVSGGGCGGVNVPGG